MISRRKFLAGSATVCLGAAIGGSGGAIGVECIFVLIIIVIAGYVIYKIIRWCHKYLPPSTNVPPPVTNAVGQPVSSPALLKLPPLIHNTTSVSNIVLQSSEDLQHWTDELSYSIEQTAPETLSVSVRRLGVELMHKSVAIAGSPEGAYAIADFSAESAPMFPKNLNLQKSSFRLLSVEQ